MLALQSLLLILGCSDYKFSPQENGILLVEPGAIEVAAACDYEEHAVTLRSVGEYAVQVQELAVEGEGWTLLSAPSLPLTLEPGESAELVLLGSEGSATLRVTTDDPDGALQELPLLGLPNTPPTLEWVSPGPDAVVETDPALEVRVADADGVAEDLVVRWESSVDGELGVAAVDASGLARLDWLDASPGSHQLSASVTDACGDSASASLDLCRQGGYLSESLDLSSWVLDGDARYDEDSDWVVLTDTSSTFQLGSAFQTTPTTGNEVTLSFSFYVSGGTGADGFALTALDTDRASDYLAQSGGCLGYGGGGICGEYSPLYGWNIEVDTYFSAGLDPTEADHLSFHFDGDVAGYRAWAELPEMEDGAWHEMTVEVSAPRVTISVDGVVYIDEDIEGYYDFPAEVGFTAATGGETNEHLIAGLRVVEQVCQED